MFREDGARLLSEVLIDRRCNEHNLQQKKLKINIGEKTSQQRSQILEEIAKRGCGISVFKDIKNSCEKVLSNLTKIGPVWSRI